MISFERAFGGIAKLINIACGVMLCLMAVHVVVDVSGRYLFDAPLDGTTEIVSYYYMVGVIFLPLPYIQFRRRYFAAEILTQFMPAAATRVCILAGDIFTAVLSGIAAWQSTNTALERTTQHEHIETAHFVLLQWPARWFVAASFAMICVAACLGALDCLRRGTVAREASETAAISRDGVSN